MRKRRKTEHATDETGIDLAPMLDFVLNLLIFFIVTTSFVKEVGLTLSRPTSKASESKEKGTILIAIQPDGAIYMDRRVVDLRAVRANIERLSAEKPDDAVVVIANREAPTGVLVQVVDQVKLGGIDNISFAATASGS